MKNKVSFMVAKSGDISVYVPGFSTTVPATHPNAKKILDMLKFCKTNNVSVQKVKDKLVELMDFFGAVKNRIGNISVTDTHVLFNGKPLNGAVVNKIIEFQSSGYDINGLIKFLNKVMENPSEESRQSLFDWVENSGLIIDDDGDVLGYKSVRYDWMDHHTGTFSNRIGDRPSMDREECDANRNNACSVGLHVGSLEYAKDFGANDRRVVVVKVNPKDVVSVPNGEVSKMRVCEYLVIDELEEYRDCGRLKQNDWVNTKQFKEDDWDDLLEDEDEDWLDADEFDDEDLEDWDDEDDDEDDF